MIESWASRIWWRRYLRRHAASWSELAEFPGKSPVEQRKVLVARLLEQVRYFGNREDALPEWREAARIREPDELWRAWPSLPIVTREMLRSRFDPREIQSRFQLRGDVDATGGSTGEPTRFFHDTEMSRRRTAARVYAQMCMGWRPGMATVIVWGSERDIMRSLHWKRRLGSRLLRQFLVGGYKLDRKTVETVVGLVLRHRPAAVYGFTSMLEFVAREVSQGPPLPKGCVHTAWCGGEMLFPEQSALFKRAFGVPILNHYGGRELSTMACQFEEGGPLHVFRPWLFCELVDDNGKRVGPGETGKLLWTSTVCRGTPFLRYEVGDLAVFDTSGENESGVFALHRLEGRVASVLELPNGKRMNNLFWNHLFKGFPEIHQFQVLVKCDGSLEIRLTGQGFAPSRQTECHTIVRNFLGGVPFEFRWVDRIPLTAQGKLLQVVRESPATPTEN